MRTVNFFTPISFGDLPVTNAQKKVEFYDSYFNVTGWTARVIKEGSNEVDWVYEKPSYVTTALKVLSYITVIIPIFVAILKALARSGFEFKFKKITVASPQTPIGDLLEGSKEVQAIKLRDAVYTYLKKGKTEKAKDLLEGRSDENVDSLKEEIRLADEKGAISILLNEDRTGEVVSKVTAIEASETKDTILEWVIRELISNNKIEKALSLLSEKFYNQQIEVLVKQESIRSLINADAVQEAISLIKSLPFGIEKDKFVADAVKALLNKPFISFEQVIDLMSERFSNLKIKGELLFSVAPKILSTSYAEEFLKIIKKCESYDFDNTFSQVISHYTDLKEWGVAQELLKLTFFNPLNKTLNYKKVGLALIADGKKEEVTNLIKSIYHQISAKEAVVTIIQALVNNENFEEAVDLVTYKNSIYTEEFIRALISEKTVKLPLDDPEDEIRSKLVIFFKSRGLDSLADKIAA